MPLLPENAILRRVGGSGFECWADGTWTTGMNFPPPNDNMYANSYEVGRWRVETIVPEAASTTDFLHYIEVGTPGSPRQAVTWRRGPGGDVEVEVEGIPRVLVFGRGGKAQYPH